ncbi:MAG: transposase [Gemmatimonadaceae bacterium]
MSSAHPRRCSWRAARHAACTRAPAFRRQTPDDRSPGRRQRQPLQECQRLLHFGPPAAVPTTPAEAVEATPAARARTAMRAKLQTAEGQAHDKQRKRVVEPVFGQTKERRGFRRFSLRGLPQVGAEWDLICLTHNLLKRFRAGAGVPRPAPA